MAFVPDPRGYGPVAGQGTAAVTLNAGLRAYMLRVYNWMVSGLLLTGIVAYGISHTSLINAFYAPVQTQYGLRMQPTALAMISMFAPLGFVLVLSFGVNRLQRSTVQSLYWLFAAAMGASLTNIFLVYTGSSIASAFFITAGTFAAMSLYGYTTQADLTRMGSFLLMGLFGIVIAGLVNLFLGSPGLQFAISVIAVVVFTGLTAWDTQRIKTDYLQHAYAQGSDEAARRSVYDALALYLNFINLFMLILRFTGGARGNNS